MLLQVERGIRKMAVDEMFAHGNQWEFIHLKEGALLHTEIPINNKMPEEIKTPFPTSLVLLNKAKTHPIMKQTAVSSTFVKPNAPILNLPELQENQSANNSTNKRVQMIAVVVFLMR
jgi:hypothetical protein